MMNVTRCSLATGEELTNGDFDSRYGNVRVAHDCRRKATGRAAGAKARRRLPALVRRARRPPLFAP